MFPEQIGYIFKMIYKIKKLVKGNKKKTVKKNTIYCLHFYEQLCSIYTTYIEYRFEKSYLKRFELFKTMSTLSIDN